jgi:outer membrane protein OmpA-like peptidoglycan-associated protein
MKHFTLAIILVIALVGYSQVQAQEQFYSPEVALGFSVGGSHGVNHPDDKWMMQYRAFLQYELAAPMLMGQLGLGYAGLCADNVYYVQTGIADVRLLFSPFSLSNLNPYLYGGFGVSKNFHTSGSDFLMMLPMGVGFQTRIADQVLLQISGGYNLSLSDKLDERERTNTDLNALTNKKNDAFYGIMVGLAFTVGGGFDKEAAALREKELAEAKAQREKELANAEAKRVKELADAEAIRVKALADAEAKRVKELADAEAKRIKELPPAQRDTVIILEKGKKVVLRGINFEFNKATLTSSSETILTLAYNALVANPDVQIEISGHTDNVGSDTYNQTLSLKRAQAVKNWLVKKGIASNRMKTVGKGENEPMASNETDEGRAENRRIEFFVFP